MIERERSWRERHPFLWGMSQTFGIFQPRRHVETVEESFDAVLSDIEWAITEAERRYGSK